MFWFLAPRVITASTQMEHEMIAGRILEGGFSDVI